MQILMVASEATPFAKTGGLADVLGALPAALAERGENVAVVIPAYRENRYPQSPRQAYRDLLDSHRPRLPGEHPPDHPSAASATISSSAPRCTIATESMARRPADFPDNHLRFAVLSLAAIGVARHLFRPNLLHLHDWQAALAPVYIREHFRGDPTFRRVKTLLTIHNLGYQGIFAPRVAPELALDPRLMNPEQLGVLRQT